MPRRLSVALVAALLVAGCERLSDATSAGTPDAPDLTASIPDTLRQLLLSVQIRGAGGPWQLVIDEGARNQLTTTAPAADAVGPHYARLRNGNLRIESADALENGPHTMVLREVDGWRQLTRRFIVDVAAAEYSVEPLEDPGYGTLTPSAIADNGDVVGWSRSSLRYRAIVWRGTGATRLPTPAGFVDAWAAAINDKGDIAGVADGKRVVVWRADSPAIVGDPARPSIPSATSLYIAGIDTLGAIAVAYYNEPRGTAIEGAIIDARGAITDLSFIPRSMNALGQVVGLQSGVNGDEPRAASHDATWQATEQHWSGQSGFQSLIGLNDLGWVIGYWQGDFIEPFLSIPGRPSVDLGPLTARRSNMVAIDNGGAIVTADGVLVRNGRTFRVALPPGWELQAIADMNNAGQLVATARQLSTGRVFVTRLTPK